MAVGHLPLPTLTAVDGGDAVRDRDPLARQRDLPLLRPDRVGQIWTHADQLVAQPNRPPLARVPANCGVFPPPCDAPPLPTGAEAEAPEHRRDVGVRTTRRHDGTVFRCLYLSLYTRLSSEMGCPGREVDPPTVQACDGPAPSRNVRTPFAQNLLGLSSGWTSRPAQPSPRPWTKRSWHGCSLVWPIFSHLSRNEMRSPYFLPLMRAHSPRSAVYSVCRTTDVLASERRMF